MIDHFKQFIIGSSVFPFEQKKRGYAVC